VLAAAVRVPWAFLLRDLRIEASHKAGLALRVLAPIATVFVFSFLHRALEGGGGKALGRFAGDYFAFAIIGLALLGYMSYGVGAMVRSIRESQAAGTLEHMVLTPTRLATILLASSLPGYVLASVSVATYVVAAAVVGTDFGHANVPVALLSLLLATASFIGLGLLAASIVIVTRRGNPVSFMIRTGSLALSGVIYPVTVLPEVLRIVAQALPLTHALELVRRSLLLGDGVAELWSPLLALTATVAILLPVSLLACNAAIRVARTDGSLTH
jgi:ABC-2 type transport system permease protein